MRRKLLRPNKSLSKHKTKSQLKPFTDLKPQETKAAAEGLNPLNVHQKENRIAQRHNQASQRVCGRFILLQRGRGAGGGREGERGSGAEQGSQSEASQPVKQSTKLINKQPCKYDYKNSHPNRQSMSQSASEIRRSCNSVPMSFFHVIPISCLSYVLLYYRPHTASTIYPLFYYHSLSVLPYSCVFVVIHFLVFRLFYSSYLPPTISSLFL